MKAKVLLAAIVILGGLCRYVSSVELKPAAAAACIEQSDEPLSVVAEWEENGRIAFQITRRPTESGHRLTKLVLRRGTTIVAETRCDATTENGEAVFRVTVSAEDLAGSYLQIVEEPVAEDRGPRSGGESYLIRLADFAPRPTVRFRAAA